MLTFATGCYSPRSLDRSVTRLAAETADAHTGLSAETVADSAQSLEPPTPVAAGDEPVILDVRSVLGIAAASSRNLQNRRDDLYRAGLSLFGTRRDFGFNLDGTLEYVIAAGDDRDERRDGTAAVSLERILPTGARVRLTGEQQVTDDTARDEGNRFSSRAQARLDQPLLAGAGYGASHEDLVQAERDYLYALRDFSLQRQQFAIDVVRDYYTLLGQRKTVENTRTNYQQFVFLRQRSEALFQVNRAPAIDVLRSQQEELTALNRLTTTDESYTIAVGRFLVQLGLPSATRAELADDIPAMIRVDLDENRALALAVSNRLDLMTARDRVEDARRRVANARNAYLPEVNAFGSSEWTADEADSLGDQTFGNDWRAGVTAEIPFDRRDRRDAIRRAELDREAAERRYAEQFDVILLEVRESYSRLRSLTVSVDIQLKNIEIAEKRAKNALLQFRNGTLSNRDVVEAANQLLDARNAYITALTDYEVQRLNLLRQVGLLGVARDGAIIERSPEG
ncbi:MAG TPA: TolC family protein [Kiritimatiellia bacterium]|nr:TolC family protein [Kiritimatiellia bacterium]HMP32717.1 TolC family protein [Kiritimatiellia bacterium]